MKIGDEKVPWVVIGSLVLVLVCVVGVYSGLIPSPFEGALGNLKGPLYVPDGYVKGDVNVTGPDKVIMYTNENLGTFFMVGATKDTKKSSLREALEPLSQDDGMAVVNTPVVVNGHETVFQVQKVDFMGLELICFVLNGIVKKQD